MKAFVAVNGKLLYQQLRNVWISFPLEQVEKLHLTQKKRVLLDKCEKKCNNVVTLP